VAGPGSGLSQEPMSGVRSVTLDLRVVPECPPGPVASLRSGRRESGRLTVAIAIVGAQLKIEAGKV
jgi:hypothetical protein